MKNVGLLFTFLFSIVLFTACEKEYELGGCTDTEAINYNSEATFENFSCEYDWENWDGGGSSSGDCPTVQCKATTQSGNRCSRMTTNCSGYCWQH